MRELGYVAGIIALLGLVAAAGSRFGPEILSSGRTMMIGSMVVGIPAWLVYFGAFAIALGLANERPKGWYWRAFAHHHLLSRTQRWLIMPWFYVGALTFLVACLGIVAALVGGVALFRNG